VNIALCKQSVLWKTHALSHIANRRCIPSVRRSRNKPMFTTEYSGNRKRIENDSSEDFMITVSYRPFSCTSYWLISSRLSLCYYGTESILGIVYIWEQRIGRKRATIYKRHARRELATVSTSLSEQVFIIALQRNKKNFENGSRCIVVRHSCILHYSKRRHKSDFSREILISMSHTLVMWSLWQPITGVKRKCKTPRK